MEKLYYVVRKMDKSLLYSKTILDDMEKIISTERGATVQSRIMKYYLSTTGMEIDAACEELEKQNDSDNEDYDDASDFEEEDEGALPDDLEESDDESHDEMAKQQDNETEGDKMLRFWKARSRKLRHGLAISAWMCSPVAKIMEDAKDNHNGNERDATTMLLKQWCCQEVILYAICLIVVYIFRASFLLFKSSFHF
jgi:hypothetical protein